MVFEKYMHCIDYRKEVEHDSWLDPPFSSITDENVSNLRRSDSRLIILVTVIINKEWVKRILHNMQKVFMKIGPKIVQKDARDYPPY